MASLEHHGISLVCAIEEKYNMDDCDLDIQIVGLPKNVSGEPSDIIVPRQLCIHDAQITHAGDTARLSDLCKNVCEVDLDRNLIMDWKNVFEILTHVPHCSLLNLRANPLSNFQSIDPDTIPTFRTLMKLVLNYTNISWCSLCLILQAFPNLEELHLSLNEYSAVDIEPDQTFPSITSLHFRCNNVSDWTQIIKLGQAFPNLSNLVLLNNPLDTFPSTEEIHVVFPNLKSINLSETQIKDWSELEKFRHFPNLCEVRVQDIPLLQIYEEDVRRQLVLGYLPNITRLNGGRVLEGEKEDSERAFIRYYMDKSEDQQPPRYRELEAKHGKLDRLVEIDLRTSKQVTIECSLDEGNTSLFTVNLNWTLMQFRAFLAKQYDLNKRKFRVFLYKAIEGYGHGAEHLSHPQRTLLNYRFEDEDKIVIQPAFN